MPNETAPGPETKIPEPSRLDVLRAAVAKLKGVKVDRVAAVDDAPAANGKPAQTGAKAHVKAEWRGARGQRHVTAHVAETPQDLDAAERAVLEVVIAHHGAA